MKPLLYLVHRLPYPPNKGDKIRSYNILRFLSQNYGVYLGTFIDDTEDEKYREKVKSFCKETHIEVINPALSKIKSLTGFVSNQALSIPYYSSKSMQAWVDKIIDDNNIEHVLAFSSPMAQFVINKKMRKIMDFVDIDSDKWQQYCQSHKGIMSLVYAREARLLFQYEKEIAKKFDANVFVSDSEAAHFKQLIADSSNKTTGISNGIDFDFFDPNLAFDNPYESNKKILVFTGAMDYWANCDAVIWFAENIFEQLYKIDPGFQFYIVGSSPGVEVKKLSAQNGIVVTGRVDDIRPYIRYADLSVAPLRIARGIQNKVLEAMAMNKVVVATQNAMEGINISNEIGLNVEDSAQGQLKLIQNLMKNENIDQLGKKSGDWIRRSYRWENVLAPLKSIIET